MLHRFSYERNLKCFKDETLTDNAQNIAKPYVRENPAPRVTLSVALLGYNNIQQQTMPVMVDIRRGVQVARTRQNLKTELQDAMPDEHQGLRVESSVQTVRSLAQTLLKKWMCTSFGCSTL